MNKPKLLSFNRLNVVPHGYVQGGFVEYNLDTDAGIITYQYELDVKVWLIPYTAKGAGTTKVDPSELVSANLKVGQSLSIGPVAAVVKSIADGKANCSLTVIDQDNSINESGLLILDVSKPHLDVLSVNEAGTVKGFSITIEAE